MSFIAVATCHFNFHPPCWDYRPHEKRLVSKPFDTREEALNKMLEFQSAVKSKGWKFSVELAALDASKDQELERRKSNA